MPQSGHAPGICPAPYPQQESFVLDVIYVLATIALFAIVGLAAKGVEKL